ncbi:MAG: CDP-alcohol phosphatidyltransferase family protein [Xanthomonadales bacterium]|nr:CDP-alcohol phosphatidyltransferase family protein [Xanthomonadales bacterium]
MLRQIPNAITLVRILLVAPLGWSIVAHRYDLALLLAAIASASDALDGFLARQFHWQSRLGAWLDPAADKLLLTVAYVCLSSSGVVRWWLKLLVLGRDVVIVAGVLTIQWLRGPVTVAPSLLSKANTLVQIGYLLIVLVAVHGTLVFLPRPMLWLVALMTVLSGLDYVVRYALRARHNGKLA